MSATISERLVAERNRLSLSQEELAKLGGVVRSAQANYEAGKRAPDAVYLSAIAKAGIDVRYVITGERANRVDMELLGMSESAIRDAYADLRGARPLRQITTNALAKVYNATAAKLGPETDRAEMVREEAASYLEVLNDPENAEVLDQALFRKATEPQTSMTTVKASGNARAAGRDMIEGGTKRKK